MYVYFIWAPETQRVKIGRSNDPKHRFDSLRTGSAEELVFLGCVAVDNSRQVERELHKIWGHWRVRGEWFEAIPELLAFTRTACRPHVTYFRKGRPRRALTERARLALPEPQGEHPPKPTLPEGVALPGSGRKAALARYKLARGIVD